MIEIEKGTSWTDPGAQVTDNVDSNLGIYYKVNGVLTPNEGRETPQINTAAAATYFITYFSTDSAGNTGIAERTVTVFDPSSTATSTPTQ